MIYPSRPRSTPFVAVLVAATITIALTGWAAMILFGIFGLEFSFWLSAGIAALARLAFGGVSS